MESTKEVVTEKRLVEAESEESSTEEAEAESPRSVMVDVKKKVAERVHSQVLRIREEESHLGEDENFIGGGDKERNNKNDGVCGGFRQKPTHRCHVVVSITRVTKPILPCSPLSGKNNVKCPRTEAE